MANKSQKLTGNDAKDPKSKKKGFEQGTGNNNTTADDSKLKDNRDLKYRDDMDYRDVDSRDKRDQSKITNEDRKITNQDKPIKDKQKEHIPMDDDSDTISQKNDPEIDPPHSDPERTEKKLPQMKK